MATTKRHAPGILKLRSTTCRLRCPKTLTSKARAVWRPLVRMLSQLCDLRQGDCFALERYCVFFVEWRECKRFIREHGERYPMLSDHDPGNAERTPDGHFIVGWRTWPQVKELRWLAKTMRATEADFGMTAASRREPERAIPPAKDEPQSRELEDTL